MSYYATHKLIGDGSTTAFSVPFPYLSANHLTVTVNGSPVEWSWSSGNSISITPAPPAGSTILIRRSSSLGSSLVSFQPGSLILAEDLNLGHKQNLFTTQELADTIALTEVNLQSSIDDLYGEIDRIDGDIADLGQFVQSEISRQLGTLRSPFIMKGTFNGPVGRTLLLPVVVTSTNQYMAKVTSTSSTEAVGDIWCTKDIDRFTIHCSENNTVDFFEVCLTFVDMPGLDVEGMFSISSISGLSTLNPQVIPVAEVLGFYSPADGGGGVFVWSASTPKASHNGITVVDPTHTGTPGNPEWYSPEGIGNGCWVRSESIHQLPVAAGGVVGDGVADDSAAVQALCNLGIPLAWGGLTVRLVSPISCTNKGATWIGTGAELKYDGVHTESFLKFSTSVKQRFYFKGVKISVNKRANKGLEVLSTGNMSESCVFLADSLEVTGAKRLNTFNGGEGVFIRGAFDLVAFNHGKVKDCELPAGQGTPGVIGIAGITVSFYSTTSFVRRCVLNGITIEKVYSSDSGYTADQDGIKFFGPDSTLFAGKADSMLVVTGGSRFVDCYGRSIKTQCRDTVVFGSTFIRTMGPDSGNGEVDAQQGCLVAWGNTHEYINGKEPYFCYRAISGSTLGKPGMSVRDCSVHLDDSTSLTHFAQVYTSGGVTSRTIIDGNRVYGPVKAFMDFMCNGDKNYLTINNNFVREVLPWTTSDRALVYVKTSGSNSPFGANILASCNCYDGMETVALVRDNISGNAMFATLTAWENPGFTTNQFVSSTLGGLKTNAIARMGRIGGRDGGPGFQEVLSGTVGASSTLTFPVPTSFGSLVLVTIQYNVTAYALLYVLGTSIGVVAKGSSVEVGQTSDPGTGTFRIWRSGQNELTVRNSDGSARGVAMLVLATR